MLAHHKSGAAVNGGVTLPRLRTRSRRRKPRGPEWKRQAALCAVWIFLLALYVFTALPWSAAGSVVFLACDWQLLHRWPCDPDASPLTLTERKRGIAWRVAGLALLTIGIFT